MFTNNNTIFVSENIKLVHSGEDYFSCLEQIINDSQSEIHLHFYIFENDNTGIKIFEALKKAALRHVKIFILLDSFGSNSLSKKFIGEIRGYGINIRFFSPFFSTNTFYIGRRLHQKVVVADGQIALIGGINIANKYAGSTTECPWLDYAVQIKNKELAVPLQKLCEASYLKKRILGSRENKKISLIAREVTINILQNDWVKRKSEIHNAYIKAIWKAEKEIIIVGSYFMPGKKLTLALKKAALKKVKIKLILSGISDVPLLRKATIYFYRKLLSYDIELFEWKKSVLHGKAAVIDSQWATIGSFNLNNLSSYGSLEMNVEIISTSFSKNYTEHLDQIIQQCESITIESLNSRHRFFTRITDWICYRLIRIIIILLTYLPYKRFMKLE